MELRPHQSDMIERIQSELALNHKNIIVDACPAYGKSLLMSEIARLYHDEGVIILINITALLDQISAHLTEQGIDHSILKSDRSKLFDPSKKVQLVMSQTLHARLGSINFEHKFKIYQQDEMHRENPTISKRSKDCVDFLNPEFIIGYSGTPYDSDGFRFNDYSYISNVHAQELQDKGYLCPIKYYIPKWAETIDYSNVKKSGNDYSTQDLEKIINTPNHLNMAIEAMNQMGAKSKKTIVFCSSIEQADMFADLLKLDGYHAEAYHSRTKFNDEIINAFINNTTYNKEPKARQASLIDDDVYPEIQVTCIVSINKLGIGFDSPDIQLAVQLRPTKVRSLVFQQIMRCARTHPSKTFSEYLDLGQTTSNFGFHTDLYTPPFRTGDKKVDIKALEDANTNSLENVTVMLSNEPTEVSRESYEIKIQEIKSMMQKQSVKNMQIYELANAFEVSENHEEIIRIACAIYTFKYGQPISKEGKPYNYRPEGFWGTSFFGSNVDFHVPFTMEEYFMKVPHMKKSWIRALKTRCRNIIKTGDKLFKITGFIKYMYDKYIDEYGEVDHRREEQYRKAEEHANRVKANIGYNVKHIEDMDDDEVPF